MLWLELADGGKLKDKVRRVAESKAWLTGVSPQPRAAPLLQALLSAVADSVCALSLPWRSSPLARQKSRAVVLASVEALRTFASTQAQVSAPR
jgi:hypothetical protein